jgi:membrane glycosyltransferase
VNPSLLRRRRIAFASLVGLTGLALLALMAATLFTARTDGLGVAMLALYAATLPWTVIGFWHAVIGLGVMVAGRDPLAAIDSPLQAAPSDGPPAPITTRTALLVCIRHEDVAALEHNLVWMGDGLVASGEAAHFHLYLLSDSDDAAIAADEARLADTLARRFAGTLAVTYRRREGGTGYKAGNIGDFCQRWGTRHDFAIPLDADSVMAPHALLRLVRLMQADPKLGIVQTLVTALPSQSAFTRLFQFGMRLGMRSYTLGAAWWQGDCGPYWGHNAILRLAPFMAHCHLPALPGRPPLGGPVLSHDQLEAVLMRRAGHEVRVLPIEDGSFEENPPTLAEFVRRDLRWCQGNLQYVAFLRTPGLLPVSRVQLLLAIAMYLGSPAWLGFMLLALLREAPWDATLGSVLFGLSMAMTFAPKLATLVDVLLRPALRRAYGGAPRLLAGALAETLFSMLLAPVAALAVTLFLLGLPLGRQIGWSAQRRSAHGLPWGFALRRFWPQTLAGLLLGPWLWHAMPQAWPFWAPFVAGLAGAVPLAVFTAHPALGRWMVARGLCRVPEERPTSSAPSVGLCRVEAAHVGD